MSEETGTMPEAAAAAPKSPSGEAVTPASKAFDLEKQKAAALDSLPSRGKQSPAFKQFFESQLCDDFLCAALDHFAALLRVEDMMNARTAGKKPQDTPPPSNEEKQAAGLLDQTIKEVSTYYCYTIMQFSRYKAAQQDRIFFESLYEFTASVVCAAFPSQHRFKIEDELGRIVRTDTFNLTKRKNDSNHHTKMYFTSRELYVLRYAGDGFMGRKILTALHPRRTAGDSVNLTVQKRSSLVSSVLPSPLEIAKQAAKETADLIKKKSEFNKMRSSSQLLRRPSDKMMPMIDKRSGVRSVSPSRAWDKSLSFDPVSPDRSATVAGGDVDLVRKRLGRSVPFRTG